MSGLAQIGRIVISVLMGLVFTAVVNLPPWTLPLIVLDSPLTLRLSSPWVIAALHVALVCAGIDILFLSRPELERVRAPHSRLTWILPSLIAAPSPLLIVNFMSLSAGWLLILIGTGVVLTLALLGEYQAIDRDNPHFETARAGLITLTYASALIVFIAVYSTHFRTILTGTLTSLVSFLLALSLLRWAGGRVNMIWPFALVSAYVIGMATWGLNRIAVNGLAGGGLLLLIFYVVIGISQQFMQERTNRRALFEFVLAAVLGLLLLIRFGFQ